MSFCVTPLSLDDTCMRHPVVNNDDRYCHQVERGALTCKKTAPDPELRSGGGVASWEDADKCIVLHLTRSPARHLLP